MTDYKLPSSYFKEKTAAWTNASKGCRTSRQLFCHVIGSSNHKPNKMAWFPAWWSQKVGLQVRKCPETNSYRFVDTDVNAVHLLRCPETNSYHCVENGDIVMCSFTGCPNVASVGAHVQKADSIQDRASWYIVPACKSCNSVDLRLKKNTVKLGHGSTLKTDALIVKCSTKQLFRPRVPIHGTSFI